MKAIPGNSSYMSQSDLAFMDGLIDDLRSALLKEMPVDVRLQGLSAAEVVQRFTPEELADGLTSEQAAALRDLLERRQDKQRLVHR